MSRILVFLSLVALTGCASGRRSIPNKPLQGPTVAVFDSVISKRSTHFPGLSRLTTRPLHSLRQALQAARTLYPDIAVRINSQTTHGRFFVFSVAPADSNEPRSSSTILYGVKGQSAIYLYHPVP